ncbi:ATP-binding cassette domain-containing protein [Bacillaceae bacterium Marseille-Q3522]|nr:ATP-binding cassette domain-containing protein [Bacillaceae bacterium Marseille-Q3522]
MNIEVSGLVKTYGKQKILDQIDLSIQDPGVYLVAGPNGSGKTTLLEILVGLRKRTDGQVILNNLRPGDKQIKKEVGFLIQQNTLRKNSTVAEELNLVRDIFQLKINTYEYVKKYNLQDYYHKKRNIYPAERSGAC